MFSESLIPPDLQASAPLRVFVSGAESTANGNVLAEARPGLWKYFLFVGQEPRYSAEVNGRLDELRSEFCRLSLGPFERAALAALREAESMQEVRDRDYEARYLKVPGLSMHAIWLHRRDENDRGDDLVLPLLPQHESLKERSTFSGRDFAAAMATIAAVRLKFRDEP